MGQYHPWPGVVWRMGGVFPRKNNKELYTDEQHEFYLFPSR